MHKFGEVRAIGFHPRGVECARLGLGRAFTSGLDGTVYAWDLDGGAGRPWAQVKTADALSALIGHGTLITNQHARTLAVLERSKQLVLGLRDGPITLFDIATNQPARTLEFEGQAFRKRFGFCALALSGSEAWLAATNRSFAAIWSLGNGAPVWASPVGAGGNAVLFLDDERELAICDWTGGVRQIKWRASGTLTTAHWRGLWGNLVTAARVPKGGPVDAVLSVTRLDREGEVPVEIESLAELEVDLDGTWDGELNVPPAAPPPAASSRSFEAAALLGVNRDLSKVVWQIPVTSRVHAIKALNGGTHLLTATSRGTVELWRIGEAQPEAVLDLSHPELLPADAPALGYDGFSSAVPWLEDDFFAPSAVHTLDANLDGTKILIGTAGGAVLATSLR